MVNDSHAQDISGSYEALNHTREEENTKKRRRALVKSLQKLKQRQQEKNLTMLEQSTEVRKLPNRHLSIRERNSLLPRQLQMGEKDHITTM